MPQLVSPLNNAAELRPPTSSICSYGLFSAYQEETGKREGLSPPAEWKDGNEIRTRLSIKKIYELTEWYFIFASTKHYNCALEGGKRAANLTPDRSWTLNLSSPNASSFNLPVKVLMGWEAQTDFFAHTAWVQVGLQKNSRLRANFTRVRWVAKRKVRERLGEGYLATFAEGNIEFFRGTALHLLGASLVFSFFAGSNWYGLDSWISET